MPSWALWLGCFGLLLVRALLGAAEAALSGISDLRARELATEYGRRGIRVLKLKSNREATAAALRMGMVVSGFLAAGVGALAPPSMVHLERFGESAWLSLGAPLLGVLLVGVLATLVEVTARALASSAPEQWAMRLAGFTSAFAAVLGPIGHGMLVAVNLVAAPLGVLVRFERPPPPLEELERMLTVQAEQHEVDASAPRLIRSIFELSDKVCRDVMVPRTDVVAVPVTTPPLEVLRILAEENHSRLPVFKDDIDHVVGVLHSRDLVPLLHYPELIVLSDIIRPAVFVPWLKPVGDLLREMQGRRIHMAMVVDEYGGFMGIVTLEDILREIVGDIGDEFEVQETLLEKQPDGSCLVDAGLDVEAFARAFGTPLPEGEYGTLGGYLSSVAGAIPEVGDRFTLAGLQFTVASKKGQRLDRVRVSRAKTAGTPAAVANVNEAKSVG
ncbi:MAG: hemolysin family protein [Myxococcaceae bacterium]